LAIDTTPVEIGTALQFPANVLQIAEQSAQSAHPAGLTEIPLLALGFSSRFAAEEMDLLTQAPELFLLLAQIQSGSCPA